VNPVFEGVYPVLPTPLKPDESPDLDACAAIADHYTTAGVHGLVCLGSGGEFPYFSIEEKREVIRCITSTVQGRVPIIVGNGCLSSMETIRLSEFAARAGVSGFLMALPTYYPVSFRDVHRHVKMVSDAVRLPILYYHYPENTRLRLSPKEIAEISEIEMVRGIKETILNLREIKAHIALIAKRPFSVLSGTSFLFLEVLKMGGHGVICPVPLIIPETVLSLYNAFTQGDMKRAHELEKRIFRFLPLFTDIPLPPALGAHALKFLARLGFPLRAGNAAIQVTFKEALRQMGMKVNPLVRTPLRQIDEERARVVERVLREIREEG